MELRQLFARNIRRPRKAKGWSQEQLAFEAGLHRTNTSGIERGVRNVGRDNVDALATALGVEPYELLVPAKR